MSDKARRAPFAAAMGCTQSSESARNVPVTSSTGGTHYPNFEIPRPFDMNPPPTTEALERMRLEFWDVQPSYGGDASMWTALRAAVEAMREDGDLDTARLLVDSAGIIVAAPNMTTCWDTMGHKYVLPKWVFRDPRNAIGGGGGGGTKTRRGSYGQTPSSDRQRSKDDGAPLERFEDGSVFEGGDGDGGGGGE